MDLWEYIPHWMIQIVENTKCRECKQNISRAEICAFGIRIVHKGEKATYFVEYQCSNCDIRTIIGFNNHIEETPEKLAYTIIEQQHTRNQMKKSIKINAKTNKGRIQDKEVKKIVDFMNKAQSYQDLLKWLKIKNED